MGLLLIAAGLSLPYALPWLIRQQGIEFQWQNPQWHLEGFSASQLQLTLSGDDEPLKQLQFENLSINWAWKALSLQRLQAEHVQIHWPVIDDQSSTEKTSLALPAALLKWLPQHIALKQVDAKLPGFGHVQGSLNVDVSAQEEIWQPASIDSQLTLTDMQGAWLDSIPAAFRPTQLSAKISTHQDDASGQQLLNIDVGSDKAMQMQLKGLLDLQRAPDWQGTLKNAELNVQLDAPAYQTLRAKKLQVHAFLTAQLDAKTFAVNISDHSSLQAQKLQALGVGQAEKFTMHLAGFDVHGRNAAPHNIAVRGPLDVHVQALELAQLHTQDWSLNGTVNGQLPQLELTGTLASQQGLSVDGVISVLDNTLQGSVTLNAISFDAGNPLAETFKGWPETVSLKSGLLGAQADFNQPDTGPLTLRFNSTASALNGEINHAEVKNLGLKVNGQIALQQASNWQATLNDTKLLVQLDSLSHPAVRTAKLQASADLTGHADAERFTVSLGKTFNLEAQKLQLPDIGQSDKATMQLPDLTLQGSSSAPYNIDVHSAVNVSVDKLSSEQLHTQSWNLKGNLDGQLTELKFTGGLTGDQGLSLTSQIHLSDGTLQGSATAKDVFFKAGNPLQKSFKNWPELVSFDSGRLSSQIGFTVPSKGPFKLSFNGNATGLSGIINRSELKNLDIKFNSQLSGKTLTLDIPNLTIEQLNPGIPLGSIQLANAHYRASINNLSKGVADWQSITARLLNGRAWLDTQKLDLNRASKVLLHVEGLELQELFKVYPAEGLAGTGIIDGQIPILFQQGEVYVEAGQLQARRPGVLQFRNEKIQDLGKSNPAMRLVADALEDFHFNLLSSAASYEPSGKLLLNIRLEGKNPDVEKGRPIHLNINLEEDIPALLASIQLSGKVSDVIQNRIRERLEKR
ncbi:YdbH domain-containing protein [Alcaligenaceae bacterium]|nr:YdbH domain-containing protein [Alcaligenaceae bacterium]